MTDSSQTQGNKIPDEKNIPPASHTAGEPSACPIPADNKSEAITEKFLTVAKEKNNLESVIMSQSDIIKGLEEEKEKLTLSLRKFSASHKSMKEKLLDFDILRNMEISELKKKIENLMADNKKLIAEKDSIFRNLERDQQNISRVDGQAVKSLKREKRELEERLRKIPETGGTGDQQVTQTGLDREGESHKASLASLLKTVEDLEKSIAIGELDLEETKESLKTAAGRIERLETELSLARSQIAEIELDRDEARAELYNGRVELDHLKADKTHVEENLQQKVDDYSREIAELKTDIDELTSAIESRIHVIDELNAKVVRLSGELSHKDSELHEKIPALLEKINSLSMSIDMKMEENSLFSKELFDLNVKISALNEEMIGKDELLIDISQDYKKQKDEIEALHGAHELTLKNLVYERDLLKREGEDLRVAAVSQAQALDKERQEKNDLEARLLDAMAANKKLEDDTVALRNAVAGNDQQIHNLMEDISGLRSGSQQAAAEHEDAIADLQEQIVSLSRELLGKNEQLALLASAEAQGAEKDRTIAEIRKRLREYEEKIELSESEQTDRYAALEDQISVLNRQLLEKNELLAGMSSEEHQTPGKDRDVEDLRNEIAGYQTRLESATAEHVSDLAALREKIALLNQQLLEKNELLTAMTSEREHENNEFLYQTDSLRKERMRLDEEMNRLTARGLEQEKELAENICLLDVSRKEKSGLEEDLAQAAEKINELVLEQDRLASQLSRKEQSLSDARAEISALQENAAVLMASQTELGKKIAEKREITSLANTEKAELQKTALEYKEAFEHLKQEIILLNRNLAEKEQAINLLVSEKKDFAGNVAGQQEKMDQARSLISSLENELNKSRHDNSRLSAEHDDISKTIARLQGEISLLSRTKEEEIRVLKADLAVYGSAVADLRLKLEQGMRENAELRSKLQASQSADREAPTPVFEKREETLPARVEKISPASRSSLSYALLALILLGGIGFSFYAYNAGLISLPVLKPAAREEVRKELAYNDMLSLLTKVSASDDLKFQATLLTESLVLKSDAPGDKALFDFQNNLYFKVSISSPREGLDDEIADDPYPAIALTAGADTVKPLTHIQVKGIKTFYRKEEPVSIMFYCAFPRTVLMPDRDTLSLSFRNQKSTADIAWDLKVLRAGNLFP
ncbi:MAG: hypothetical protein HZB62_08140 [Nitrospirae bacterium]|nr:hypothetical protein [Nitrospirota bacterium]